MKNLYKTATPMKIWLVGASQGIGLELIKIWLEQGHSVIASARAAETSPELADLSKRYAGLKCLNLDVTDPQDTAVKADQAWSMFKGIDLWFYNVGAYQPMKIEQWQWQDFVKMNQANYLGAVALMLALQPHFAKQGRGRWIWNISLASYFGLPYGGGYSAPKAALLNLAESLQPELAQQSIALQVINHGFVKTRLTAKNDFEMPGLVEPPQAARLIDKGLQSKSFEIRFPFGLRFFLSMLKLMPYSWALSLTRKMLKPN
ncbi:SDR family NAD(P)-dependent oxidoreductase [Thiomicrospira microaerophila]|uniref:SDR family NAD(P)-dependent oxidoreductase n=1 Tax=Thiomicrospira microaerophila TaxID=406020 RepID=UPI00200E57C2|nr:SDR family NAD(P)-dependent oxidoreductase [Thiomicrospira microaerophila]UQB42562.1 SDR family NAD(P)-dependent oxidoreductase [Thiomicrospira microaerophila]